MSFKSMLKTDRRSFLKGLIAATAALPLAQASKVAAAMAAPPIPSWCPPGWLPCDGRTLLKSEFPKLYGVIGAMGGRGFGPNPYGEDDLTFNLPDMRDAVLKGIDAGKWKGKWPWPKQSYLMWPVIKAAETTDLVWPVGACGHYPARVDEELLP